MKDDPASIKARKEHGEWMKTSANATDIRERFETQAAVRGTGFCWMMAVFCRWLEKVAQWGERKTQQAARETYRSD